MTLKTLIAADVYDVALNEDEFAEAVAYTPVKGKKRTVIVLIQADFAYAEEGTRTETREDISVQVGRDETHAKGGINEPKVGDIILRAVDVDPSQRPYAYMGNVDAIEPNEWIMQYTRHTVAEQGINARLK